MGTKHEKKIYNQRNRMDQITRIVLKHISH